MDANAGIIRQETMITLSEPKASSSWEKGEWDVLMIEDHAYLVEILGEATQAGNCMVIPLLEVPKTEFLTCPSVVGAVPAEEFYDKMGNIEFVR